MTLLALTYLKRIHFPRSGCNVQVNTSWSHQISFFEKGWRRGLLPPYASYFDCKDDTNICVTKTTKIYVVRAIAQREANAESRAKLSVFPVNSFKMVPGYHRFGRI